MTHLVRRLASALAVAGPVLLPVFANASPSEWKEWRGVHYRVEADGNFSCYSEDGVNCQSGTPSTDPLKVKPLVCGRAHKAVWPTYGYDVSWHWCNVAYANLFAQWFDYSLLGHRGMLSKNARGDTMCRSFDGTNCDLYDPGPETFDIAGATALSPFRPAGYNEPWVRELVLNWKTVPVLRRDLHAPPMPGRTIRPLVCGAAYTRQFGHPGYDTPDHWCDTPEILAQWIHPAVWDVVDTAPGMDHSLEKLRIYKLPLPTWDPQDQPFWVAKVYSETFHREGYLGLVYNDRWLGVTIPGWTNEAMELVPRTPQTLEFRRSEIGWSTVAFLVEKPDKVRVVNGAGRDAPLRFEAGVPTPKSHTSTALMAFRPEWNMTTPATREFTLQMYIDASYNRGVSVHNMPGLDEVVMARKRIRPVD